MRSTAAGVSSWFRKSQLCFIDRQNASIMELEKSTSTWASTLRRRPRPRRASTAPLTFSTPESPTTVAGSSSGGSVLPASTRTALPLNAALPGVGQHPGHRRGRQVHAGDGRTCGGRRFQAPEQDERRAPAAQSRSKVDPPRHPNDNDSARVAFAPIKLLDVLILSREKPLDITTILADPFSAQDDVAIFGCRVEGVSNRRR